MIRRFVQFGTEDQVNILDLAQKTWNLQDLNFLHFESETEVWNQDPVEFFPARFRSFTNIPSQISTQSEGERLKTHTGMFS